jgi:DICT domain-containing protein/signal transduction histidine kinase
MSNPTSVLEDLLKALPDLRIQIYFKSSLTALSHAMEDQVLAGDDAPLVIASFQRERFYRQEAQRYRRIADRTAQVYVLAAPEADFANGSDHYETVAFTPEDGLAQEWHLVVVGASYAACLVCRERSLSPTETSTKALSPDQSRRFEGLWTFERRVVGQTALLLLDRILAYRPELATKVTQARQQVLLDTQVEFNTVDPGPFADRLVTYLQAGQHKLAKAYRSIALQERKERLVNSITSAIRRSLQPDTIFAVASQELGQALHACRCLIYPCHEGDRQVRIQHEFLAADVTSLQGQSWPLQDNALFQAVVQRQTALYLPNVQTPAPELGIEALPQALMQRWQIGSWLMVPVIHNNRLLGMVELHGCGSNALILQEAELDLVEAIATQIGIALIQAEAYTNLEVLNRQLEALDRTRSNLIAITGHELRTPLSTIQVCLESLASEPDMPPELSQVMLDTALTDAERMRKLIQDFLTLSDLESGRVTWHMDVLPIRECVDLAFSSLRHHPATDAPHISTDVALDLPLVRTDGEWIVEVLTKLLDNACKFTPTQGQVAVHARPTGQDLLEVTVVDTGRGIEPDRLEIVFDRFYQEEGALRRSAGGTGLGLAICRQIITGLGGQIWAESQGKDQGSQFHFTVPLAPPVVPPPPAATGRKKTTKKKA